MNREASAIDSNEQPTLFLIGIDDRLTQLLNSMRLHTVALRSPEEFLAQYDPNQAGCIVCEAVFANGMSGFQFMSVL